MKTQKVVNPSLLQGLTPHTGSILANRSLPILACAFDGRLGRRWRGKHRTADVGGKRNSEICRLSLHASFFRGTNVTDQPCKGASRQCYRRLRAFTTLKTTHHVKRKDASRHCISYIYISISKVAPCRMGAVSISVTWVVETGGQGVLPLITASMVV